MAIDKNYNTLSKVAQSIIDMKEELSIQFGAGLADAMAWTSDYVAILQTKELEDNNMKMQIGIDLVTNEFAHRSCGSDGIWSSWFIHTNSGDEKYGYIEFHSNYDDDSVTTVSCPVGAAYTIGSIIEREGYILKSFSTASSGYGVSYNINDTWTPEEEGDTLVLYAQWEITYYDVTFMYHDQSGVFTEYEHYNDVPYGTIITKPDDPYIDGWVFSKWGYNDYNSDVYEEFDFTTPITSNLCLHGEFIPKECELKVWIQSTPGVDSGLTELFSTMYHYGDDLLKLSTDTIIPLAEHIGGYETRCCAYLYSNYDGTARYVPLDSICEVDSGNIIMRLSTIEEDQCYLYVRYIPITYTIHWYLSTTATSAFETTSYTYGEQLILPALDSSLTTKDGYRVSDNVWVDINGTPAKTYFDNPDNIPSTSISFYLDWVPVTPYIIKVPYVEEKSSSITWVENTVYVDEGMNVSEYVASQKAITKAHNTGDVNFEFEGIYTDWQMSDDVNSSYIGLDTTTCAPNNNNDGAGNNEFYARYILKSSDNSTQLFNYYYTKNRSTATNVNSYEAWCDDVYIDYGERYAAIIGTESYPYGYDTVLSDLGSDYISAPSIFTSVTCVTPLNLSYRICESYAPLSIYAWLYLRTEYTYTYNLNPPSIDLPYDEGVDEGEEVDAFSLTLTANDIVWTGYNSEKTINGVLTVQGDVPATDYFYFDSWNTMADGSGRNVYPYDDEDNVTSDVTLYAQWKQKYVTVIANRTSSSSAVNLDSEVTVTTAGATIGSRITINSSESAQSNLGGIHFPYDNTVDGTDIDYDTSTYEFIGISTTKDAPRNSPTVMAEKIYYIIDLITRLGYKVPEEELEKDTLTIMIYNAWRFTVSTNYSPKTSTQIVSGRKVTVTETAEGNEYDDNYGDALTFPEVFYPQDVIDFENIHLKTYLSYLLSTTVTTRVGSTDGSLKSYDINNDTITVTDGGPINLFAGTGRTYTVNFVVDGEVYSTYTGTYGSVIEFPDEPTKSGYEFIEWQYYTDDGEQVLLKGDTITENIKAICAWESVISYSVKIWVPIAVTSSSATSVSYGAYASTVTNETTVLKDTSAYTNFLKYATTFGNATGFTFDVLCTSKDYLTQSGMTADSIVTGSINLYPRFKKDISIKYTNNWGAVFNAADSSFKYMNTSGTACLVYGRTLASHFNSNPTLSGSTFKGWYNSFNQNVGFSNSSDYSTSKLVSQYFYPTSIYGWFEPNTSVTMTIHSCDYYDTPSGWGLGIFTPYTGQTSSSRYSRYCGCPMPFKFTQANVSGTGTADKTIGIADDSTGNIAVTCTLNVLDSGDYIDIYPIVTAENDLDNAHTNYSVNGGTMVFMLNKTNCTVTNTGNTYTITYDGSSSTINFDDWGLGCEFENLSAGYKFTISNIPVSQWSFTTKKGYPVYPPYVFNGSPRATAGVLYTDSTMSNEYDYDYDEDGFIQLNSNTTLYKKFTYSNSSVSQSAVLSNSSTLFGTWVDTDGFYAIDPTTNEAVNTTKRYGASSTNNPSNNPVWSVGTSITEHSDDLPENYNAENSSYKYDLGTTGWGLIGTNVLENSGDNSISNAICGITIGDGRCGSSYTDSDGSIKDLTIDAENYTLSESDIKSSGYIKNYLDVAQFDDEFNSRHDIDNDHNYTKDNILPQRNAVGFVKINLAPLISGLKKYDVIEVDAHLYVHGDDGSRSSAHKTDPDGDGIYNAQKNTIYTPTEEEVLNKTTDDEYSDSTIRVYSQSAIYAVDGSSIGSNESSVCNSSNYKPIVASCAGPIDISTNRKVGNNVCTNPFSGDGAHWSASHVLSEFNPEKTSFDDIMLRLSIFTIDINLWGTINHADTSIKFWMTPGLTINGKSIISYDDY